MKILLFGVSNVGKSTVGRLPAERLGFGFADLDEEIKKHLEMSLEEFVHTSENKLVLIAPATETTTAIKSFFRFLQLEDSIKPAFENVIIKKGGKKSEWYSISRAMKNIEAKVQWYHDEEDDTTPLSDVLKVKEKNYTNIDFVITKGLGHRRIYRDNKVAKSIIDFL